MKQITTSIENENVTGVYELACLNSRKSFYGKATVLETETGRYLKSYDTIVCFLSYGGTFVKMWDGYSATTMRHINSFMCHCGLSYGGKAWWDSLQANKKYGVISHAQTIMKEVG